MSAFFLTTIDWAITCVPSSKAGARFYLCTAFNEQFANQIAAHFGIFKGGDG
ncbi:hypothetical protein [Caballeronia mineralivorans]|uniref:hypothetical protein n=1 Tax=Caballeronia mineralivorans TaxID=2010198 RepID=UPI0023F10163|nr:hypothetical protein [Caballeronia mineralivorans]MDB5780202.1 hypothetical protein [Caballeronia mineralivorans]